jgi:hypothetical protein
MLDLKRNTPVLLLLIAINIVNLIFWFHGTYTGGNGGTVVYWFTPYAYAPLFSWTNLSYTGMPQILGSVFGELIAGMGISFTYIFGSLAPSLISGLLASFGAIGMYLLVYALSGRIEGATVRLKMFGSFCAAVVFTVHIESVQLLTSAAYPIPYVLLAALFLIMKIDSGQASRRDAAIMVLFLAAAFGFAGYADFLMLLAFFLLIGVVLLATARREVRKKYIYAFGGVMLIALTINLTWIISTAEFLNSSYMTEFNYQANAYILDNVGILNLPQALFAFGPTFTHLSPDPIIHNPYVYLILVGVFVVAIAGAIARMQKNAEEERIVAALAISYIGMVIAATTVNAPFGVLFSILTSISHITLALRLPFYAVHPLLILVIAVLFGLGIVAIFGRIKRTKVIRLALIAVSLLLIFSYIYMLDVYPILRTYSSLNSNATLVRTQIPQYVINASNFINSQEGYFSVASLPSESGVISLQWYYGTDIYSNFIGRAFYNGAPTVFSVSMFSPISAQEYFKYAGYPATYNRPAGSGVAKWFDVLGIKYVLVEGDILTGPCSTCSVTYPNYSVNTITSNLDRMGFEEVSSYNTTTIYENGNYVPLVYAAHLEVLNTTNISRLSGAIESPGFNPSNTAVYLKKLALPDSACFDYCTTILYNSSKIEMPSGSGAYPTINYTVNDPTSITVRVSHASSPFYLVFRETYDGNWIAYYNGSIELNGSHIAVNGFANAWYVDKKGSYTIELSFAPQEPAWVLWIVSVGSFVAVLYVAFKPRSV